MTKPHPKRGDLTGRPSGRAPGRSRGLTTALRLALPARVRAAAIATAVAAAKAHQAPTHAVRGRIARISRITGPTSCRAATTGPDRATIDRATIVRAIGRQAKSTGHSIQSDLAVTMDRRQIG